MKNTRKTFLRFLLLLLCLLWQAENNFFFFAFVLPSSFGISLPLSLLFLFRYFGLKRKCDRNELYLPHTCKVFTVISKNVSRPQPRNACVCVCLFLCTSWPVDLCRLGFWAETAADVQSINWTENVVFFAQHGSTVQWISNSLYPSFYSWSIFVSSSLSLSSSSWTSASS